MAIYLFVSLSPTPMLNFRQRAPP